MKKALLFILASLSPIFVFSQKKYNMVVETKDGMIYEIKTDNINRIRFVEIEEAVIFDNLVSLLTNSLTGDFIYGATSHYAWDFGLPSFFLQRDVMGQDMAIEKSVSEHYTAWYACGENLEPSSLISQFPWLYYYSMIDNCNTVLKYAGEEPDAAHKIGAGIAYAIRAMLYMDLARMYASETYAKNTKAETVPIVTETTANSAFNPRATNERIFNFILSDLDKAESYLANYKRYDVFTPDLSVVYGLKARAYLTMEDWSNALSYAQKAMSGYEVMTAEEFLSQTDGFNKPNGSWMFGLTFSSSDPNITENDADSSWGSQMIIEVSPSECGYSANYVGPKRIDAHLYSTIPETDFRKKCWIDPSVDKMPVEEALNALLTYTNDPQGVYKTGVNVSARGTMALMPVKFRPRGGFHDNQYTAFTVAVPLMRVEEMKLIEAEAAGMLNEADGIAKLTAFAQTRDPNYEYGTHDEAYYNTSTGAFRNEVWWQRRVELWGEGFATFDIKRLQKGIIRSYEGTNHIDGYQWNVESTPDWMNLCISQTEINKNAACTNNPTPNPPKGNSSQFVW